MNFSCIRQNIPARNRRPRGLSPIAAALLGLLLSSALGRATTFDWVTSPAWTTNSPGINGTPQTVDYWSATGNAISVSIANTGAAWDPGGYPQVSQNVLSNGGSSNGLILRAASQTTTTTYIQVTINFNYTGGASGVSFNLWDIDATITGSTGSQSGFIDTITNIKGITPGGSTVYATANNSHTSNPGTVYNNITGSGASLKIAGDTVTNGADNLTDQGQVNLSFSSPVSSVTFQWSNTADTTRSTQTVGVGPITFTGIGAAFPEVNSSMAALMLCGGLMGVGRFRRRTRTAEISQCPMNV